MLEILLLVAAMALVAACGGFVAAEFSFVTVDRSSVTRAEQEGQRGAAGVSSALSSLSTQLSGAQLGITITNLAIGFMAEPAIAGLIHDPLAAAGVPEGAVTGVATTTGLVIATVVTMVFGELFPKNVALAAPLATARWTQAYQRGFTKVMMLPIRLLNGSANALVRAFGVEPQEELGSARSPSELSSLIRRSAEEGTLDSDTAVLMQRSVAFSELSAGDIMTPRVRVTSLERLDSVTDAVDLTRSTGHSRFPVVDGDLDSVVGTIHIKAALAVPYADRDRTTVGEVCVEAPTVPETLGLDPLLALLRSEGFHLAVVVDEYGGTAGIVTLEDVVEEMVGEIVDEHDRWGGRGRRYRDGSWSLSGLLRPDEVAGLTGQRLPESDDYSTVAGLVLRELGRMAEVGDEVRITLPAETDDDEDVHHFEASLTVTRLDGHRVDRLRMRRHELSRSDVARRRGGDA